MSEQAPNSEEFRRLVLTYGMPFIRQVLPAGSVHAVINGHCHPVQLWAVIDCMEEDDHGGKFYCQKIVALGIHEGDLCMLDVQEGFDGFHETDESENSAEGDSPPLGGDITVGEFLNKLNGGAARMEGTPSPPSSQVPEEEPTFEMVLGQFKHRAPLMMMKVEEDLGRRTPWERNEGGLVEPEAILSIKVKEQYQKLLPMVRPGEGISPEERKYLFGLRCPWGAAYVALSVLRVLRKAGGDFSGRCEIFTRYSYQEVVLLFRSEGLAQLPASSAHRFLSRTMTDQEPRGH